ncbi:hypothetical protein [Halioxenophilus sp. WMMB6]|uniref:hypothetical protein n=1 Tax=Halioxenophilus sp. WMMB6 TaxID=3073815 RepID=UPI00295F55C1|nr:hypothetical protein [Halioxenophilus sp. WMMB6]
MATTTQTSPYNCDLDARNNITCEIDFSNFSIVSGSRKWLGPGDHFEVELPANKNDEPQLTIVDGQSSSKKLKFKKDPTVPFQCQPISDHLQYLTFSAGHGNDAWRVEVIRERFPSPTEANPQNDQCRVYFFFYSLSETGGLQSGANNGGGGGFQRY